MEPRGIAEHSDWHNSVFYPPLGESILDGEKSRLGETCTGKFLSRERRFLRRRIQHCAQIEADRWRQLRHA
jgi:hypothetical protein